MRKKGGVFHRLLSGAAILFVGLSLPGCGSQSTAEPSPPQSEVSRAVPVAVTVVEGVDLAETFTLPGTLEAWEDLSLAAETAGPVRFIGPEEGDRVGKGEVILKIDPEARQADLARAQAEFEAQRKNLERMNRLLDEKIVSPQEFENARSRYEVARAALRNAEVALEKSVLVSPVAGVVDRLLVDRGEYVSPGTPVAEVVQVDRLQATVEVPEKDVPFIQPGDRVEVVPALVVGEAARAFPAEVIYLAYKADAATRTYRAKVAVDNRDGRLRPGMILRVRFVRRKLDQVIAVPLYAVVERGAQKAVFVVEDGLARLRPVTLGSVVGDRVVISEGLVAGEALVVKGQQLLTDGAAVRPEGL